MNIFTALRISVIFLSSFFFTCSFAQEEKDYFITIWDYDENIQFYVETTGDVNYKWETIPAEKSGTGIISKDIKEVKITNLPKYTTIRLKLAPQYLKRFSVKSKISFIDIQQWGTVAWTNMEAAFENCQYFKITAKDLPNLDGVSSMARMFSGCKKFKGPDNINQWNTNNVTNMQSMFLSANSFNLPIGDWNTHNIIDMSYMFHGATSFNQPIGNWNTEKVTNMESMFFEATSFNQSIGSWRTTNVTNMRAMFERATNFDKPIGDWDTQNVTNMKDMFYSSYSFNQNIGNWNTQNVTNMNSMFASTGFNQNIGNWNTQNVTDMSFMFYHSRFNQSIGNWNTTNVITMRGMFDHARYFNQPIGNWDTQNVSNMGYMFHGAKAFNQNIENWNTAKVVDMNNMFYEASSFNQPIGDWNTSKVTDMSRMFFIARSFNQAIGNWNTQNVKDMSLMFSGASSFNHPIGNWNTTKVTDMSYMFSGASSFNHPIGNWNTTKVTDMSYMFSEASSFNHPIGNWNTTEVTDMFFMFYGARSFNQRLDSLELYSLSSSRNSPAFSMIANCGINCQNYSYTLLGWASNPNIQTNLELGAGGLKYSNFAKSARDILTKPVDQGGKGWKILGDELSTKDCDLITAQQGLEEQFEISIFPNPAQIVLFLKNAAVDTPYKIIDWMGREISIGQSQNRQIPIATLPSGLYLLFCQNKIFTFVKE